MFIDLDTRLEIVTLYYKHGESTTAVLMAFKTAHQLRKNPFSRQNLIKLIKKFKSTKSLHRIASIGRPSLIESRKDLVTFSLSRLQLNNIHGHASTSGVAKDTGTPQRSVARILRSVGMHPYKITLCQVIKETD